MGTTNMTLRVRILAACGFSLFAGALHAADLLSVYERALQNDPLIREADATRLASRESKPLEVAALTCVLAAFAAGVFVYGLRLPLPLWPAMLSG